MKTVCVTGHRPAKLPWGYKKEGPDYDEYIESLACTIADYLENGYDHFITGMALGVDICIFYLDKTYSPLNGQPSNNHLASPTQRSAEQNSLIIMPYSKRKL